jgi:RNA polymerase sigma-70 factor (ECF subfamily)
MNQYSVAHPQESDAELYQRYAPMLLAYLLRRIASREDAEDVLLEIFLAVFQKRSTTGLDEQRLQYFIWAVARNKVVDYHRRNKQRLHVPLPAVEEGLFESEEEAPEQVALRKESNQQLYTMVQQLPRQQREVVLLRFGHGLNCSEIATIVEKSEGAVRMTLHRALKILRTLYTGKE